MSQNPEKRMPFTEHLRELRDRLVVAIAAVFVGTIACFFFSEQLLWFLAQPLLDVLPEGQKTLQFTGLPEVFIVYIKVALVGGITLSMPVLVDQFWRFISPALYAKERRLGLPVLLSMTFFFLLGLGFAYTISPFMFQFFSSFQNEYLRADFRVGEFFTFYLRFLIVFGVTFELPVLVLALAWLGVVTPDQLAKYRRHVFVLIFVSAAVLTPPDVITQIAVGIPLCILFELSILTCRIVVRRTKDEAPDASAQQPLPSVPREPKTHQAEHQEK